MLMLISFPLFVFGLVKSETEIHRERRSIAPWKVFARQDSFSTEHTFVYYIRNLSGISLKFLDRPESFKICLNVSELSGKFRFFSGNFPYCLESIQGPETFQIFWQVTKLSGNFQKCLENFQIVSGLSVILP